MPKRRAHRESERSIHAAIIDAWALISQAEGLDPRLLQHTPNEGRRSPRTGACLRALGMRAGWPDLHLAVQRGHCGALFIEIKTARGRVSAAQSEILGLLADQGYATAVVRSAQQGVDVIREYLRDRYNGGVL